MPDAAVLTAAELSRRMPSEPGLAAHCRRVAALSIEIGRRMNLAQGQLVLLEQAALLHHSFRLSDAAVDRLAADLGIACPRAAGRARGSGLDDIVALANILDEQFECRSLDPAAPAMPEALRDLKGVFRVSLLEAARKALAAPYRLPEGTAWRLPVRADSAGKVLRYLRDGGPHTVESVCDLANADPVLAAGVVRVANSALHGKRYAIKSVRQAVSYIGLDAARQILMALAVKPLFASAALGEAWRHAAWMAEFCEILARATGALPADEAFLLGLIHDIGGLALQTAQRAAMGAAARLAERGCPAVYVEETLFGEDHAAVGAALLREWRFPEETVAAVQFHHRPADADSIGACALHSAEFWSGGDEDLPSLRHLNRAWAATGWSMELLMTAGSIKSTAGELLRVA